MIKHKTSQIMTTAPKELSHLAQLTFIFMVMLTSSSSILKRLQNEHTIWRVLIAKRKSMKQTKMNTNVKIAKSPTIIANLYLCLLVDFQTGLISQTFSSIKILENFCFKSLQTN